MLRIIGMAMALGVVVLAARDAWAQATMLEFTATESVGFGPFDEIRTTGNITHILGLQNTNRWENFQWAEGSDGTDADKYKIVGADGIGIHELLLDVHVNQRLGHQDFGHGTFAGTSVVRPGGPIEGIWECNVRGQLAPEGGQGLAVCTGTGELAGQQLRVRNDGGALSGRILVPGSVNTAAVPEPATATLGAIGLLALAGLSRRRQA